MENEIGGTYVARGKYGKFIQSFTWGGGRGRLREATWKTHAYLRA